jgi:hypothetical protein
MREQERVAVGEILNGNGAPIRGAQVSPTGVVIDGLNNSVVLDAAGNPIWVNSQGQLLNGNGTAIAGAAIQNGTTINYLMKPLVLGSSGQPLAVSLVNGTLTPLDALGSPIPGATFDPASKAATAAGGQPLPLDFSGDVVGLDANGTPVDATSQRAPIPGAKVDTSGKVVVPLPGAGPGGPQNPVEIDGAGKAQPVTSSGVPLGPDGAVVPGLRISPTGQLVDANGNPATIDDGGNPVSLDRVGGQPLPNQPMAAPSPLAFFGASPATAPVVNSTSVPSNSPIFLNQGPLSGSGGYSVLSRTALAAATVALAAVAL